MNITGPFHDDDPRHKGKKWYLSYFVPKKHPDGTLVLANGKPVLCRKRPYYDTKEEAQADKPAILAQYASAGVNTAGGVMTRDQAGEYEQAKLIVPEASLVDVAQFWRLHHPLHKTMRLKECAPLFLTATLARLGKTAGYEDLKSRVGIFVRDFADRIPDTVTRGEFMRWLETKPTKRRRASAVPVTGRTILNLKQAVCRFYNWMREEDPAFAKENPAGGIKRARLPKVTIKEIRFLTLDYVTAYLRAAERYDPEIVAHEIIQLLAGVRADDEMANFQGDWVLPATKEVKIPAEAAKTEVREVINTLEPVFWSWWKAYGRKGALRPKNYPWRWRRIRILAGLELAGTQIEKRDELAALSARAIVDRQEFKPLLQAWPWNARRRTFVTYHVALHQSADRTAIIVRHRGDSYTLHNSYRGLGVTEAQGGIYFALEPQPVDKPIRAFVPERKPKGIVRRRLEEKSRAA
jgi:hypothetical protein